MLGAGAMTASAVGAAFASRAAGGCIAMCTNGTVCNTKSGLCDDMPCRGLCDANQHCEQVFTESKCVPGAPGEVTHAATVTWSPVTIAPVTTPSDTTTTSPTIVPAAEK